MEVSVSSFLCVIPFPPPAPFPYAIVKICSGLNRGPP
jgi:hypothetical protein